MSRQAVEEIVKSKVYPAFEALFEAETGQKFDNSAVPFFLDRLFQGECNGIPNQVVMTFLARLVSKTTPENDWLLGYHLVMPLSKSLIPTKSRPPENFKRVFEFCFIEWLVQVFNVKPPQAAEYADQFFNTKQNRLYNWYATSKKRKAERDLAFHLVEFALNFDTEGEQAIEYYSSPKN